MGDIGDAKQGGEAIPPTTLPPSTTPNNSLLETTVTHMAARTAFLAVFIIVGFVGNCVLLATIAQSHRLKKSMLNLFVISAATVNLVDCAANMPIVLGSTIIEKWDYGDFACRFNAFLILMTSIEMCLSLTLMAFDRCLAVENPSKYNQRLNITRANIMIVYTWVHSAAFAFPLLFNLIKVKPFQARYLCSISENNPLLFICLASLFGYILPLVFNLVFYVMIIRSGVKEKLKDSQKMQRPMYTDFDESRIWVELNAAKYAGSLFVLWCLLQGPYLLLNYIEEYRNSSEIMSGPIFKYPWEVDFAFTWMKFSYPMFLPFITFFWRKEVWQKFKNLILCRKNIQINDASPKRSPGKRQKENGNLPNAKKDHESNKVRTDIPVIFATSKGLHLQSKKPKDTTTTVEETRVEIVNQGNESSVITTRKCDVFGSRDLQQLGEDTSDYDSAEEGRADPFSGSDPVVVKAFRDQDKNERPRSLSMVSQGVKSRKKKQQVYETFNGVLSPSDVKADPFELNEIPHEHKRKRKKQKRNSNDIPTDIMNVPMEDFNDSDTHPADISDEKISNDSGRGTVEKKTPVTPLEKFHVEEIENDDNNEICSKPEPPVPKPRKPRVNSKTDSNQPSSPRRRRKKKKQKQKDSKEFELDNISNSGDVNKVVEDVIETVERKLPKRPHRLAPLDHKRNSNTNNVDFTNFHEHQKNSQDALKQELTAFTDKHVLPDEEDVVEPDIHISNRKTRRKSGAVVATELREQEQHDDIVDHTLQDEKPHRRTRTISSGDSQTTLLGSNTSSDLSGVKNFNATSGTGSQSAARKKRRAAKAKSASQQTLLVDTP